MPGTIRLLLILLLTLAAVVPVAAGPGPSPDVFLGASALDLKLDIDTNVDIAGPTHFFSGRKRMHAGGRMAWHTNAGPERLLFLGRMFAFGWGKTSFQMNWEEPGIQSFDPLDASISHLYLEYGLDGNLHLGRTLHLSALASTKWILQNLSLEVGGDSFHGTVTKLVGALGAMATLDLRRVRLSAGVQRLHFMNDEVEWNVDDLDFDSRHTEPSLEYFVGVVFR